MEIDKQYSVFIGLTQLYEDITPRGRRTGQKGNNELEKGKRKPGKNTNKPIDSKA